MNVPQVFSGINNRLKDHFFRWLWSDGGWQPVKCQDGSWSLRPWTFSRSEAMHNLQGAYTETVQVYQALWVQLAPFWMSYTCAVNVGLGLGWHELAWASQPTADPMLVSFEVDSFLVAGFLTALSLWVEDSNRYRLQVAGLDPQFVAWVYGEVFQRWPAQALAFLWQCYQKGCWIIASDVKRDWIRLPRPAGLVFYDLFSKSQLPDLWDPEWIRFLIQRWSAAWSAWASFATWQPWCQVFLQEGFNVYYPKSKQLKRRSFWAWRGYPLGQLSETAKVSPG